MGKCKACPGIDKFSLTLEAWTFCPTLGFCWFLNKALRHTLEKRQFYKSLAILSNQLISWTRLRFNRIVVHESWVFLTKKGDSF